MRLKTTNFTVIALAVWAAVPTSHCLGSYHFMQIEKIVGGVNGDATAQAIQLRMRSAGQGHMDNAKLVAWDAGGENPVVIINFQNAVPKEVEGAQILITSLQMSAYTAPSVAENFTMERLIPESYLAVGSLTFENDDETLIAWRVSWGGAAYSGDTTGALTNDDDREFGPPYDGSLPLDGLEVLEFLGDFDAKSSSNDADYSLSDGPGILTNNANESFTLIVPDCSDPNGAGPDSDNDSVRDACDECPDDADKSETGICGCGVPDTDSNFDGTPDCHDPDQVGGPDNENGGSGLDSGTPALRGCTPGIGVIFAGLLGLTALRSLAAPSRIRRRAERQ